VRAMIGLLLTGLAVELALMPIALYHFHKAGLYSVAANMIAIPLTTFVIMPLEAGALLLDSIGAGAPLWAATGWTIDLMLGLAASVAEARNAVTMLPTMPRWAFGAMVFAGLWLCLWRGPIRWWAGLPFALGAIGAASAPVPDLLVTGDGQHLAIVRDDGTPVILRSRSGDFVRSLMSEAAAFDGDPLNLEEQAFARCTRDSCIADVVNGGRAWRVLAIRSRDRIEWTQLTSACADADIVVASRRLPKGCTPRWLKLDRAALENSGGVSLYLTGTPRAATVGDRLGQHPWRYRPVPWTPRTSPLGSRGGQQPWRDRPTPATTAASNHAGQPARLYPSTAPSASPLASAASSDQTASSLPPGSMK